MKKTLTSILIVLTVILTFSSCNNGYITDKESGVKYKFFVENKNGEKPNDGDIVVIDFRIAAGDSLLFENSGGPTIVSPDGGLIYKGDIYPALSKMHIGDSLICILPADSIKDHNLQDYFDFDINEISVTIKMVSIYMTKEDFEQKQKEEEEKMINAQAQEKVALEKYISDHKIKASPTESGLYFIETKKGNGSIQDGQTVKLFYTGKLLDGSQFDSNIEKEPMSIIIGANQVIPGFEEGVSLMKNKGKATLIIPSKLAYGNRSMGTISPFSTLVFDIEIVDVE